MGVSEFTLEGDAVVDSRQIRSASYRVPDDNNHVIALERETR
jgi:hypothetical protein